MSQGKYHGKPLSATEVTRLYDAGERDFRGAILRGNTFHKANLSGADFSGADICSARFVDATLQNTNFSHAKAGLQRWWAIGQIFLAIVITAIIGFQMPFFSLMVSPRIVEDSNIELILELTNLAVAIIISAWITQGLTLKALVGLALAAAFEDVVNSFSFSPFLFAFPFSIAFTIVFASTLAITVSLPATFTLTLAFTIAIASISMNEVTVADAIIGLLPSFILVLLLYVEISRSIQGREQKFEDLRIIGLAFAALGGTSFSGADLSGATFVQAMLKSSNFADSRQCPTILSRVRWHGAQQLDRARLGMANLQDFRVLKLLTTLDGIDQDFSNADLRGANLAGAKLHRANLRGANLNGALLEGAELYEANLTEANCIATDFTAAHLTGACLEAWNIDSTTILQNIDCQHVFLREKPDTRGDRERRPHNPNKDFQLGDFEKFFREMLDTVQILIRNGVDPHAFRTAFENVMAEFPSITHDSIQSMEKKGSDVLLTLHAPEGIDKGKLERLWDEGHQRGFKEGYSSGFLESQKQRADDIKEVALSFSRFFSPIQINNMNNPINTGDGSFYAGGDVNLTGSTLNLGTISGQVSNQINQIPAPTATDQPSLKDILAQLQIAVETDSELSDEEKAEALQAVGRIATAGAEPNLDTKAKGIVKRATDTLKGLAESLTDASNLAEACKTLLPTILSLFALI